MPLYEYHKLVPSGFCKMAPVVVPETEMGQRCSTLARDQPAPKGLLVPEVGVVLPLMKLNEPVYVVVLVGE